MVQAQSVTLTLVYTYNADGLRVAQDVSGTTTAFVWDWATPVPELLHDGDNVYLVGLDTLGWWDGETWTFALPDALGSVRQTTDITGAVTDSREWSPFGVEIDGAQAGLGYTGEWWDDGAGLLYLRARWYDAQTGRFTSRDLWEGDRQIPSTMNGYSYVLARPIVLRDPLGLFPTKVDIESGNAVFTCDCGWIDWNHVAKSQELAFTLIDDLRYASENYEFDPLLNENWGVRIGIPLGLGPIEFNLFNGLAVIPNTQVNNSNVVDLAVSIFMDANEHFEELQGKWGQYPIPIVGERLKSSYYSEEDLPSDIIGFYIATQRHTKTEGNYSQIREKIENEICNSIGKEASLRVFSQTYRDGSEAICDWRNWHPRFLPLVETCNTTCAEPRVWPPEFSGLTSRRVLPQINGPWWWATSFADTGGVMMSTSRPNVVRFSTRYLQ
jgi:RHS repeat-associated protein